MSEDEPIIKRQSTFPLFSTYFKTHPVDVVEYSVNTRKQMEDYIDAFKKRMDCQITYSKNLANVSKTLDKYIKPGTELAFSFISSAFKVQNQQRSRQALVLAESIKTEIQAMCTEMLQNHTGFFKKLEKDTKRYYKQGQNYQNNYRSTLTKYEGINTEMEEMIITKNIMKFTTGIPQQKKAKLISKTMESIKQNKQYERLYAQSLRQFNSFANIYNNEIKNQLDQAQNMMREELVMQVDCMRKLIVFEIGMYESIRHDMLNISKQMEYIDTQKDIELFVEDLKNSSVNKIIPDSEKDQDSKRTSTSSSNQQAANSIQPKKTYGKSMLNESLLYVQEEYFSWMLSNKRNKKLRSIISKVWRVQKEQLKITKPSGQKTEQTQPAQIQGKQVKKQEQTVVPQQVSTQDWQKQLKQIIAEFKIIVPPNYISNTNKGYVPPSGQIIQQVFLQITRIIAEVWNNQDISPETVIQKMSILEKYFAEHHLYRLIGYIFIEQYRLQHQVMLKGNNSSKNCAKIVKTLIKESQKKKDTFVIRGLLGLIFTFYWIDDKTKKLLFLSPEIYQCEIWKKNQFWQAAIFETTYEEMVYFAFQKGETQAETILRQKNLVFSQLASFCHYMVMLGITSKNVRLIVGRYCRLYEMTQEQNKDLSKMITNTSKQYKDTVAIYFNKTVQKSQIME